MRSSKSASLLAMSLLLLGISTCQAKPEGKEAPTVDLEDYIDTVPKRKSDDLSTSATGYYGHGHGGHHHQPYHGHVAAAGHHHPVYHTLGHHHHLPYHHGYAQTYFNGEYGTIGHIGIGSAHVSYGTDINHGHSHHHHYQHSYHG